MIDQFTIDKFREVLPGRVIFQGAFESGEFFETVEDNEYTYLLKITDDIFIKIRSSVSSLGIANETGEDSIRHWLVDKEQKPLGNKINGRWTTRVPGWEERLISNLRRLWKLVQKAGYCTKCGNPHSLYKIKNGTNKGKIMSRCNHCDSWKEILDET